MRRIPRRMKVMSMLQTSLLSSIIHILGPHDVFVVSPVSIHVLGHHILDGGECEGDLCFPCVVSFLVAFREEVARSSANCR